MKMLSEVKSLDEVDNYLDKKLANKEKSWDSVIVYIKREIHKYLKEMSRKITSETGHNELYEISLAIEKRMHDEKGLIQM